MISYIIWIPVRPQMSGLKSSCSDYSTYVWAGTECALCVRPYFNNLQEITPPSSSTTTTTTTCSSKFCHFISWQAETEVLDVIGNQDRKGQRVRASKVVFGSTDHRAFEVQFLFYFIFEVQKGKPHLHSSSAISFIFSFKNQFGTSLSESSRGISLKAARCAETLIHKTKNKNLHPSYKSGAFSLLI